MSSIFKPLQSKPPEASSISLLSGEKDMSVGSARASRAVFGALTEHTVRSAGRRPVEPTRPA